MPRKSTVLAVEVYHPFIYKYYTYYKLLFKKPNCPK